MPEKSQRYASMEGETRNEDHPFLSALQILPLRTLLPETWNNQERKLADQVEGQAKTQ
jgi:hypothetical protein